MRRDTLLALGVVLLLVAALTAKSLIVSMPPLRNAPGEFDAGRAKARLAFVLGDQRPHPADSAANDLLRGRLVEALRQMGIEPIVRDQTVCNDFQRARLIACARVRNVIGIIGPKTGKALVLSAHYDSVPVGPGAADDGIGVATLLEVGSILKQRPLKRPIILLFDEGEELGLLGARAFLADPLSRNVDGLLNFEARGVNGPVTMFETNSPNGAAISTYGAAVRHPFASSLSTDVARLIPNDTDVTVFKERGWLILNSGIIGNETRYHSPGDNLEGLDLRSLQDMGDEALALAANLSASTPQASGNRIFFDVGRRVFVQMPLALGVICLLGLFTAFGAIAWRRGALVRGSAIIFGAMIAGGVSGWLAVTIMVFAKAGTYWRAHPEITFTAIYATVLLGMLAVFVTIRRSLSTRKLRTAVWFLFLLLGAALALVAPGGIIFFLIPPAAVLLGIAASRWHPLAERIGGLAGFILLYLTWGPLLGGLEEIFSPGPLWTVAPVAVLLLAPALVEAQDLFTRANRVMLLLASAAVALIGWIAAGTVPAYSQDHQQRFTIEHVTEFPSRRTSWSIVNDGTELLGAYASLGRWHLGKLGFSERQRWLSPTPAVATVHPPAIEVVQSNRYGIERRVRLRLHTNGFERIFLIAPAEAHIRSAGVAGYVRPIGSADSSGKFTITCSGRSCDGMEMAIDMYDANSVRFIFAGARNGLPPSAAPLIRARPRFARPQYTPDETLAISHVNL